MAGCPGRRNNNYCNYPLWKCKKCGNVGCQEKGCPNQGFDEFGRCRRCGESGTKESF